MTKIFNIIYYLFISAIAALAIILLISVFPITGNIKILTVLSGSMEPAIKTGSLIIIKPAPDYKTGDIITFGRISRNSTPITHRIVEIKGEGERMTFITKGDANKAEDLKETKKSEVLGKVVLAAPYLGYAVSTAKKPWGFFLIIVVPSLLVIFDEAKKIKEEIKKIRQAKTAKTNENQST